MSQIFKLGRHLESMPSGYEGPEYQEMLMAVSLCANIQPECTVIGMPMCSESCPLVPDRVTDMYAWAPICRHNHAKRMTDPTTWGMCMPAIRRLVYEQNRRQDAD